VAVASQLVRRPELWLLDEPHAGLDAASRDDLDELVAEAVAGGATVLFASHEVERGRALATRVVTLVGGVVASDDAADRGPAPDVPFLARPAVQGSAAGSWRRRLSGRRAGVA